MCADALGSESPDRRGHCCATAGADIRLCAAKRK